MTFLKTTACAAIILLAFAAPAAAKDNDKKQIHVHNCAGAKVTVCVYNGGDILKAGALHRAYLKKGEEKSFKCKGNGKHRCKLYVVEETGNACPLDVGKKSINVPFNANAYVGRKDGKADGKFLADVGNKGHCVE